MKTIKNIFFLLAFVVVATSCDDGLDIEPTDKITADDLFGDPEGTKLYLADLYDRLPIEDLTYFPEQGFNLNHTNENNGGRTNAMMTMMAQHSEGFGLPDDGKLNWWVDAFSLIRDVNLFIDIIPTLTVTEGEKTLLMGEAAFIRGFAYLGLAKRYGGVPIILEPQDFDGDPESLKVPRNTEKETWDFVLAELQVAANLLGESNGRRVSKWAALALKSRAALHAASLAKYGGNVDFTGEAVNLGLIGLPENTAAGYYQACIDASNTIMKEGPHSLYKPNPVSVDEAAENIREMFANPNLAPEEAMLIKGRTIGLEFYGNNYEIWFNPNQKANGWPHPGRYCPTLEYADMFENYSNPGVDGTIVTTVDGDTENYNGFDASREYLHFADPTELFADKDARLKATVILPYSEWKGDIMVYQAGFIKPNGDIKIETNSRTKVDGEWYFTYGSKSAADHNGFNPSGGNHSKTGFGYKKFLTLNDVVALWNSGTTDFAAIRYAEVLINYAEAVVESGLGDAQQAATALNATRRRAFHKTDIPLTIENVLRERAVELAFENRGVWDLMRRRSYHTLFNNNGKHGLKPVLDLRGDPPYKHIFLRDRLRGNRLYTFDIDQYYRNIPGVGLSGLVPNP